MLRLHDFECRECRVQFESLIDADERTIACDGCWGTADRIISAPAIHTLETHYRGYNDSDGKFIPAHGAFLDQNLVGKDRKPAIYSSLSEKNKALDAAGLHVKEGKQPKKKGHTTHFTGGAHRG